MNQRIRSKLASWIGHSAMEGVDMGRGSSKAGSLPDRARL
jgi:hypothetical protein